MAYLAEAEKKGYLRNREEVSMSEEKQAVRAKWFEMKLDL